MNKVIAAHVALFAAMLIYAISFIVAKYVTPEYIKPFGLVVLRAIGAVLLFWTSGLFIKEKIERKDIFKFLYLSIFGVAINQLMFLKGLSLTSSINASIIMITSPILVLLIANFILKDKITLLKFSGIVLGFAGAATLMLKGKNNAAVSGNFVGDIFIFINASSWAFYLVLVKPMMRKYHTITILKWVFLFGLFWVFPFGIGEVYSVQWSTMPVTIIFWTLFVIVFTTFIAYLLNTYALDVLSPGIVSAYIYLQPLLTTAIALLTNSDTLDGVKIISSVMIFSGVYLASYPVKK